MLNRSLLQVLGRPSNFQLTKCSSAMQASRFGKEEYETLRFRNKKYKAAAKERRRIVRAKKTDEGKSPNDMGEELPPFMIPPRYKLIFKYLQANKNATRL